MTAKGSIEQFVQGVFDLAGVERSSFGPADDVWRVTLPDSLKRFLGRDSPELLYTFDMARWDVGARLECLHPHAALVERLCRYALARGVVAEAHVPDPSAAYASYLAARFRTSIRGQRIYDESRWLAESIMSQTAVRLKGGPFELPNLVEGRPPSALAPAADHLEAALARLADRWNSAAAQRTGQVRNVAEAAYARQVAQIAAAREGEERRVAIDQLGARLEITTECRLEMALLLWLPAR